MKGENWFAGFGVSWFNFLLSGVMFMVQNTENSFKVSLPLQP